MNLDDLNREGWPQVAVDALDDWQQGDVIDVGAGLMWMGVGGEDPLIKKESSRPTGSTTFEVASGYTTGLAVITTQTCDVIGYPPGSKQPWVQVSPICEVTDANQLRNIRFGWLLNYALITASDLGLGKGNYAVDLRHSFPVSKAVLLSQSRRSAFAQEADVLSMAERLAIKAGRASHHDLVSGSLAGALRDYVKTEKAAGTWKSPIEQFRIVISEGTRLQPRRIRLLVLTRAPAPRALTSGIAKCMKAWQKKEGKRLVAACIDVEAAEFRTLTEILVPDYRDSVHLAVEEVTRRHWF